MRHNISISRSARLLIVCNHPFSGFNSFLSDNEPILTRFSRATLIFQISAKYLLEGLLFEPLNFIAACDSEHTGDSMDLSSEPSRFAYLYQVLSIIYSYSFSYGSFFACTDRNFSSTHSISLCFDNKELKRDL